MVWIKYQENQTFIFTKPYIAESNGLGCIVANWRGVHYDLYSISMHLWMLHPLLPQQNVYILIPFVICQDPFVLNPMKSALTVRFEIKESGPNLFHCLQRFHNWNSQQNNYFSFLYNNFLYCQKYTTPRENTTATTSTNQISGVYMQWSHMLNKCVTINLESQNHITIHANNKEIMI